jgi:hypothetical protein
MALDKEQMGNFVGVAVSALRGEMEDQTRRAERLDGAMRRARKARAAAEAALETSRAQRLRRRKRLGALDGVSAGVEATAAEQALGAETAEPA